MFVIIFTLVSLAAIVLVIALFATFSVIKDVNRKLEEYEKIGETFEDEKRRFQQYETASIRKNIKSLTWIYVGICLAVIGVSLIFVFYF